MELPAAASRRHPAEARVQDAPSATDARRSPPSRTPDRGESKTAGETEVKKTSRIAPSEPEKVPIPESKGDTATGEPPKPDEWSDAQVIAALRDCVRLLAPIAADVEVSEPVKRDQCGAPGPVMLRRIGMGANKVEISPPAMLNCSMVVSLHAWVEKTLQPAAQDEGARHQEMIPPRPRAPDRPRALGGRREAGLSVQRLVELPALIRRNGRRSVAKKD